MLPEDEDYKEEELADYVKEESKAIQSKIKQIDQKVDLDRIKEKEENDLKLIETVFDVKTRLILYSLMNKDYFNELGGAISTGKEANVYYAKTKSSAIAIKIFRIDAPSFKKMRIYVEGDYRFKKLKSSRSGFIEQWAKKEFKNLKRMEINDIPAPKPIIVERNILLMEFLGYNDTVIPLLKDCNPINQGNLYQNIMENVKKLYRDAHLVHADLSEYNILYNVHTEEFFFIDVSQSVLWDHPRASEFLVRDISNINRYFQSLGINTINISKLFKWVTGFKADESLILSREL